MTCSDEQSSSLPALPEITNSPKHHPDCCLSISTQLLDSITNAISKSTESGLVVSIGSGTGLLEALLYRHWKTNSPSPSSLPSRSSNRTTSKNDERNDTINNTTNNNINYINVNNSNLNTNNNNIIEQREEKGYTIEAVEIHGPTSPTETKTRHLNRYIPTNFTHTLKGSWELSQRSLFDADVWMFVYPRSVGLVEKYFEWFLKDGSGEFGDDDDDDSQKYDLGRENRGCTMIDDNDDNHNNGSDGGGNGNEHARNEDTNNYNQQINSKIDNNENNSDGNGNITKTRINPPKVNLIIYLGPKRDWFEEYSQIFTAITKNKEKNGIEVSVDVEVISDYKSGLLGYEVMVCIRRVFVSRSRSR